jgi:hypothetical protein
MYQQMPQQQMPQQQIQQQQMQQQQMQQQQMQKQQMQQQQMQQQQMQQQQMQQQQQAQGLPFTKLSISDAIGLVTLRLGRVEQFIIDYENGEHSQNSIPDNSKIIDTSVLTSIINRLDSLEKREPITSNNEQFTQVSEDIKIANESIKRLNDELVKTNIAAAKHSEQMLRFEREFVENKDILKSLLIKFDLFVKETNDRFTDYEYAIAEIEKNIQLPENMENLEQQELEVEKEQDQDQDQEQEQQQCEQQNVSNEDDGTPSMMSVDLKNLIKQELANESM